jgi:hypothetical protein
MESSSKRDTSTEAVIGAAIEVHRHLGPGLLKSAYEPCLVHELRLRGFDVQQQVPLQVTAVESLESIHQAQLLAYMKLSGIHKGLLMNFNVPLLRDGLKRLVI